MYSFHPNSGLRCHHGLGMKRPCLADTPHPSRCGWLVICKPLWFLPFPPNPQPKFLFLSSAASILGSWILFFTLYFHSYGQ